LVELANVARDMAVPEPTDEWPYWATQLTVWAWEMAVETYWNDCDRVQVPERVWEPRETVARAAPPVDAVAHSVESIFDMVEKFDDWASVW
jgi:hypothetical protein